MIQTKTTMITCTKEKELATMATQIKNIVKTTDRIEKKLDELGNTFASKWVEKVAIGSVVAILTGIIIALIQLL